MKPFSLLRRLVTGTLILSAAAGSAALTLGRSQGVALIGKPLNVSVQLGLDAGTDTAATCLEADVFYGDTRMTPSRVTARLESSTGDEAVVRVRSVTPVNEPVVTVYLNVGCGQRTTRRYILLAEQPGDEPDVPVRPPVVVAPAAPVAPASAPARRAPRVSAASAGVAAAPVAGAAQPPAASAASSGTSPLATPGGPAPAWARSQAAAARAEARAARRAAAAEAKSTRPDQTAPVSRPPTKAAAAREQRARLKLEPLDLSIERDPTLRSSDTLSGGPDGDPARRAQALAIWKAINANPEDILRDTQRMLSLEGDVKALRDAVQKNNRSLTEMRGELETARTERYANPLVYALLGLLVAALLVAAYMWRRRGSVEAAPGGGKDWWRGVRANGADSEFGPEFEPPPPPSPRSRPVPVAPRDSEHAVDLDLSFSQSALDSLQSKSPSLSNEAPFRVSRPTADSDFQASQPGSMRAVKAEEVHDIQQQADFFVSLGEFERAIDVLRSHINAYPDTSAVAWLDLLEIYHQLGRREDYESTRQEFHDAFNAEVPAFDNYQQQSEGMEAYPAALSRIVALWPSPKVLDIIEESIFRKPGHAGSEAFGLRAYRELLMLYNIGKDVIEDEGTAVDFESSSNGQPMSDFSHTSIQPLSAVKQAPSASRFAASQMPQIEPPPIGLDINLDEPDQTLDELMQIDLGDDKTAPVSNSNLLDFDLPDVDMDAFKLPPRNSEK